MKIRRSRLAVRGAEFAPLALVVAVAAACSSGVADARIPEIHVEGSRAVEYRSLAALADRSSAIVVVEPTGEQAVVPLPSGYGEAGAAPTLYDKVRVARVLAGEVAGDTIRVVSPGIDANTGRSALSGGGPYLLFVAPAMYGADDPAGGYVVTGGPAGLFAAAQPDARHSSSTVSFLRVDDESPALPESIDTTDRASLPQITRSEAQLLREGP